MDRLGIKFTGLSRRDGNLDKVKKLVESATEDGKLQLVNYKDRGGSTPLMAAVWDGATDTCNYLVENGANVNLQNLKGNTALHFAYECSRDNLVEYLLSKGADPNRKNYLGKVPADLKDKRLQDIQRAKEAEPVNQAENIAVAVTQTKRKSTQQSNSEVMLLPALLRACKNGDLSAAVQIVEDEARNQGMTVKEYVNRSNSKGSTGLMSASWHGRLDVAALYIELGADVKAVNRKRNTAMHFALERLHYEVAAYLKLNGAKECLSWRNRLGFTPVDLKHQSENKHVERRSAPKMAAIERANRVRQDVQIELFRACRRGDIKLLHSIVQDWEKEMRYAGMGVLDLLDFPDKNLSTPLICAVFHNQAECVEFLVTKGVSLSAANNNGNTSLHIAYARGYSNIAKFLLEKGADPNIKNDREETPEEAAVTAMAEKAARLQKEMEAKKAADIFEEQVTAAAAASPEQLQPRRPSTDKPSSSRPIPKGPTETASSSCGPQQKLELAQALDKQFSSPPTMIMDGVKPIPAPEESDQLEHVENVFTDDGVVWEVFENHDSGMVMYHNPSNETWFREADVWRPCRTPVDSFGVHIDYWHNFVTGESSWKMPRVLLPKKLLVLMPNNKQSESSTKIEGVGSPKASTNTKLSASTFQAMAMGMGLTDVLEHIEFSKEKQDILLTEQSLKSPDEQKPQST